jgi:hypothetical protein
MRRAVVPQHDCQSAHALPTDEPDFDLGVVRLDRDHGRKAGFREVDGIDPAVGPFQDLSQAEGYGLEVGLQQAEIGRRHR